MQHDLLATPVPNRRRSQPSATELDRRAQGKRWTKRADNVVRETYPDYGLMRRRLRSRSLPALKRRAADLGVVNRRHVWTNREVAKLSALVRQNASNAELATAFPSLRLRQIVDKARHLRLPARRARLAAFSDPILATVRARAFEAGVSLVELDRRAQTGRYFQKSGRRPVLTYIAKAVAALGGEVRIEWME